MTAFISAFNLLQIGGYDSFFKEDNPIEGLLFIGGIGGIVLIVLIVNLVRHGVSSGSTGISRGRSGAAVSRRFNPLAFHKISTFYGLDKDQTRLLEFVFRNNSVTDPERVLKTPALLDKYFKNTFRTIEKNAETDEEAQLRLARLFKLRNTIESVPQGSGGSISSTNRLSDNTPAVLSTGRGSFTVKVISARGDSLLLEIPRNSIGSPVKIPKGSKVTLSFFSKSSKGFSFESRVLGNIQITKGLALEVAHSARSKPLIHRRYRRKDINTNCIFNFVFIDSTKTGRKQAPKLVVDSRRFTGVVLDISAGGCSIKTSAPVQVGTRLKIEINYNEDSMIAALGQVLRTNRSGTIGTIVHIKFLKIPRRSLNNVNAMVYGYDYN